MVLIFVFADAGEAGKFEYLYGKYKNLLYYKAYEILRDPMAAEDAVSEAFVRVFRNMDKVDDPDSARCAAFLGTIARNVALTMAKRRAGEQMDLVLDDDREGGAGEDPADPFDLEEAVLDGLSQERLCSMVERLDEVSRTVFVMKYAYDLPAREIAAQTGLTENNVTVRLHRTRKRLSEMAAADGGF